VLNAENGIFPWLSDDGNNDNDDGHDNEAPS
jgi:hypothetical protein